MKCSNCGKNNANVSFQQNINGEVTSLHLCEECAHKLGIFNSFDDIFSPMTLDFDFMLPEEIKCKNCGYTLSKYKSTGLFGCDNCYSTFKNEVDRILKTIQGSNRHVGRLNAAKTKTTKAKEKVEKVDNKLDSLKTRLQEEIKAEEFEKAAITRDEIKKLEKEGNK
jgi:protein arginine kinase activator